MKRMKLLPALFAAMLMIAATSCTKEELVQPNITKSAIQNQQDEVDPGCVFPLAPADEAPSAAAAM